MERVNDKESIKKEKRLVARCVRGDRQAWEEFVEIYKGLIYNTILKTFQLVGYRNTEEIADDLFQEVFAMLLKDGCAKLNGFKWKNDCSLVYWLGVITKNLTFDYIRRFVTRERILVSLAKGSGPNDGTFRKDDFADMSFLGDIEEKDKLEFFKKVLKRLPKTEMRLMELIYFRGVTHERAAAVLGKSVDAVYMQKKRAIDRLKTIVKKTSEAKRQFSP